ncbi:hypothetical protein J0910_05255 [Nocardiopsis sp. CNT-189]|uniref:B3/B4 domain-containing protein n=1 Tax=Nocardiopsis oceanisediminis TaxID=2816862 RepID=UPI003B2E40BE
MHFRHSDDVWAAFPELAAGVLTAGAPAAPVDGRLAALHTEALHTEAKARLADAPLSALPEIGAWRRAFTRMGLKPTQYRCASESLLRRFAKEGTLPGIHPLVDLCNAVSMAYAIPVAALDLDRIDGDLEVRPAGGGEVYVPLSGGSEHPAPGEIVFADTGGNAHARRWTNRQSGLSAIRPGTGRALIVAEAMHDGAAADVGALLRRLAADLDALGAAPSRPALLTRDAPGFTC